MSNEHPIADRIEDVPHPAENPNLVGHDEILAKLANQYHSGKIHHAWILCGPRGIGKATLAFQFAAHLFRYPNSGDAPESWEHSAGPDAIQSKIARGGHPNILHLTRPWDDKTKKFKTQLTVDEIRLTVPFFGTSSGEEGWRVAIVDSVDEMNASASNALLKILEEPPVLTLFFLISHSQGRMLPTIRSRCQSIALKPLEADDLLKVLDGLGILGEVQPEDHDRLALLSQGSVRRAITIIRNEGIELYRQFNAVSSDLANTDWSKIHSMADAVCTRGREDRYRLLLGIAEGFLEGRATNSENASSDISELARWAEVWEKTRASANVAERYNLDRKQVILDMFQSMGEAAR